MPYVKKRLPRGEQIEQARQIAEARGYYWVKWLKDEFEKQGIKKRVTGKDSELLALTHVNDPYYIGSPANRRDAGWFAKMWEKQFKGRVGIHIRGVHYVLFTYEYKKLDGTKYRNIDRDWQQLLQISKIARILRYVPADAFDDHRTEDPHDLSWNRARVGLPGVDPYQFPWSLPSLQLDLSAADWSINTPSVEGYEADDYLDRAFYLELWTEKSAPDDVLAPLCRELGIRFVPSKGYQSVSNYVKLCQRAREICKPVRIFYISDLDDAGENMPVAVSRGFEFWRKYYAPDAELKLKPIAVTKEQVIKFHLPAAEEGRKVEIDALLALRPGELEKIVRDSVAPYLDATIKDRLDEAEIEARRIVREEWNEATKTHKESLEALRKGVERITQKYEGEAAKLNRRLQRELKQFKKPLAKLQSIVQKISEQFDPELPERPKQDLLDHTEKSAWLYDSAREYLEQLRFYKSH